MAEIVNSSRGKWRYTPGYWTRAADGARVEKCQSGHRKGVWKAIPGHLQKPIQSQLDAAGLTVWRGYGTAREAMAAIDKHLDEGHAKICTALANSEGK